MVSYVVTNTNINNNQHTVINQASLNFFLTYISTQEHSLRKILSGHHCIASGGNLGVYPVSSSTIIGDTAVNLQNISEIATNMSISMRLKPEILRTIIRSDYLDQLKVSSPNDSEELANMLDQGDIYIHKLKEIGNEYLEYENTKILYGGDETMINMGIKGILSKSNNMSIKKIVLNNKDMKKTLTESISSLHNSQQGIWILSPRFFEKLGEQNIIFFDNTRGMTLYGHKCYIQHGFKNKDLAVFLKPNDYILQQGESTFKIKNMNHSGLSEIYISQNLGGCLVPNNNEILVVKITEN